MGPCIYDKVKLWCVNGNKTTFFHFRWSGHPHSSRMGMVVWTVDTRVSLPPATTSLTTCKCLTPSWRALNSFRSNRRHSRRMEWTMDNRRMVCCVISIASFPGLPCFCSLVCGIIQWSRRVAKPEKAWKHLSRGWRQMDTRWTWGGGEVLDYKYAYMYVCNKPESEFLTGQAEYSWSCVPRPSSFSTLFRFPCTLYYTERGYQ